MTVAAKPVLRCERCGEPLASGSSPAGDCLHCLLLDSLARSGHGAVAIPSPPAPTSTRRNYQHYEILTQEDGSLWELGRGAMGVTYKALDVNLRVPVALKIIHPRFAQSAEARQRFVFEAQAAARLRHPNVASVFHFGTIRADAESGQQGEEECFYAMEFVEGETLEAHLRRTGPLDAGQVVGVALQITRALVAAEKRGIIHRDLKPANLMLVAEGKEAESKHGEAWVKVIDFGLAKAVGLAAAEGGQEAGTSAPTVHGGFSGTPHFASPEQFDGRAVDGRADVFSLGVVLWYALTGELPFEGASLRDIHEHQMRQPLPLDQLAHAHVPTPLVELLTTLLSPEPAARPASAAVLYTQLERCREALQRGTSVPARPRRFGGWRQWVAVTSLLMLLVGGNLLLVRQRTGRTVPLASPPSAVDKSVAVLPFENFSADKDSAVFADGVQDEVLTDLAKVADLKVTSRSSVMAYKDAKARNLREIGQALGVAYVVEGSVQKAGNQIRVTAQLIDARTDAHRWAEKYDRSLNDVFAIQSDIAQAIAGQLQAAISPRERSAMLEPPTRDVGAYTLYLQAKQSLSDFDNLDDTRTFYDRVLRLLTAATARDPRFTAAFAMMAEVQALLYQEYETNETQAALVRGSVESMARLRPGSAEARYAAGVYDETVRRDFAPAREHFAAATRLLPNDADAWLLLALSEFHLGRWADALEHLQKAAELEPGNDDVTYKRFLVLEYQRRFPEALVTLDQRMAGQPAPFFHLVKAKLLMDWQADLDAARAELAAVPAGSGPDGYSTLTRLDYECRARDFAAAERALATSPAELEADRGGTTGHVPRSYYEGLLARYRGDGAAATSALTLARTFLEQKVRVQALSADELFALATVDAALDRPQDALAEARHALALGKPEKDAWDGPLHLLAYARVLAWTGERDEAIHTLQALAAKPGGPAYGDLKLHPDWDLLRRDARFEALVASLAPK